MSTSLKTKQGILVGLTGMSILSTLSGSVLANNILDKECPLWEKDRPVVEKFFIHYIGGVCGFGVVTGFILMILLGIQLYLIINLDKKGDKEKLKKERWWLALITAIIIGLYFIIQLLTNSSFVYRFIQPDNRAEKNQKGLWDYMLPTFVLQISFLIILFTEV